ncbi:MULTISPECIES: acyl-CoA thioesterase II [Gammaproteobacteria]|uniref:acyl-CoA thioesterase n=1 Tax=Gammaproteobacteria TaxID=1236 RepID=UPI000DCF7DC5|nr:MULTISPECIES: thioesterase family protein [Gammaproteobacteria]RTE85833.1 thioesterase family protein [Aliidiomarina sp. B3213]TCZ90166.1 thioesterase family protein [Lysobacter sp. N42]
MHFSEILAQIGADEHQTIHIPEGWGQGRALFGGLVAGIAYHHGAHGVQSGQLLRAMTVSFVAPVAAGDVELSRVVLRQGKNVTQTRVDMIQSEQVVLSALLTFGAGRESIVNVNDLPKPNIPSYDGVPDFPKTPFTPEFTQHYNYAVTVGGMPFSGNTSHEFGGWVRYSQEQSPINIALFLGLVDAWPPAVITHLTQPAPASSLTWTIEFPEPLDPALKTSDWWQYLATIDYAADGYGHTHAHIWDHQGNLVAISRQTVTVFG